MSNFDAIKLAVESSMPNNTVLYDDRGLPSIMVRIPKFKISDVIAGGTDDIHPAFIVDGVEKDEIYISKYQNIVMEDRAYSLAMQDPKTTTTFDQARTYCENKGRGWHLMTNAEWVAIALWCKKNGFMPRGNNNYGSDHAYPHEKGIATYKESGKTARIATGSGTVSWAHDNTNAGIYDLNGNVWEWVSGMRLKAGEIQIIPNNNAAVTGTNQSDSSTLWKAVSTTGALVDAGTAGTLKYDYVSNKITLTDAITTQADALRCNAFESIGVKSGITPPQIVKALGLYPADTTGYEGDYIYINNGAGLERVPIRGGYWLNGATAGVFYLTLNLPRSNSNSYGGFRSAFVSL